MQRREFLFGTGMAVASAWSSAHAQTYPEKPIKLIVPYPPGGNTDVVGRLYAQKLAERLKQPVIIDNRGGAAGTIGAAAAAKSPADGYTIVIGDSGSLVIATFANSNLSYSPLKDFSPISLVSSVSIVVCVRPDSPIRDMADLIARAKASPGKITIGTPGNGSPPHLAYALLASMSGIDLLHVPYKGGAAATTATIGGEVDLLIDGTALAQVKGGRLRAIAVTGPRLAALPDVPSIGETVKGFEFTNWWGILAPFGTRSEVVNRLNSELTSIAALPEVRERLTSLGLTARSGSPNEFGDFIRAETEKIAGAIKAANIKFS
ncbi:MAG: Bug family tripartite tricarboxylate transporter substrate binding protein [Hylemonella sp.]